MTDPSPPPSPRSAARLVGLAALALVVLVVAGAFIAGRFDGASSAANPRRVREAVEASAAYLDTTELRGDDTWIATQGAAKLGPGFRTWGETLNVTPFVEEDLGRDPLASKTGPGIEGRLWSLRWLAETAAPPLPAPELGDAESVSTALSDEDLYAILRVMAYTVVCSQLSAAEREAWLEELAAESQSYRLTHQLLAVMLGRNQGCLDAASAEPLRVALATRLWREQAADPSGIHDLSIERMAILCYAQVCDWLRDEWVDELLATQEESGAWGERNPEVHPRVVAREEHTAALAFYVLAATWQERFAAADAPVPPPAQGRAP